MSGFHDHEIIMIAMDEKQPMRSISRLSHRRPPIIVIGAVLSGVHDQEIIMVVMDEKQPMRRAVMSGVHDHEIIMIAMDGKQPGRSISRLSQWRPPSMLQEIMCQVDIALLSPQFTYLAIQKIGLGIIP
ncbi:hypothetical protein J6590_093006 [Homalodisca vitripennis]|nr:hypothetical protein J6590_093006 [Homalodisca vitripennis]